MSAPKNLIGLKIGILEVKKRKRENNKTYYYCKCDCGTERWFRAETLNGKKPSCGCLSRFKAKDIRNKRYDRLVAKEPTNKRDPYNGSVIWICECDCGSTKEVSLNLLEDGSISSCGCKGIENSINNGKIAGYKTKEVCIEGTNLRNLTANTPKNNTSGTKGVTWDKARSKWLAQIVFKDKHYFLGRYEDKQDAIQARKLAEEQLFGEFLEWYKETYKNKR